MKTWSDSIRHLKGIGSAKEAQFAQLGIFTIQDLFFHFPFRYDDLSVREIHTIQDQEKVSLQGKIVSPPVLSYFGKRKSRLHFRLGLPDGQVVGVTYFNQPFLKKNLELGQEVVAYGKWQSDKQSLLGMKLIRQEKAQEGLAGVYPSIKGLRQATIAQAVKDAFDLYGDTIIELVPTVFNEMYKLLPLRQAIYALHFPQREDIREEAKRKMIYTEFFLYQFRLQSTFRNEENVQGIEMQYDLNQIKEIIQTLPFHPTHSQQIAVNEIFKDLKQGRLMRRMLQGDVGSGKTLVAFLSVFAAVTAGYQVALMVPTEILAQQHYYGFERLFSQYGYKARVLVSNLKTKEKQEILSGLASGEIAFVIGTHALIQENVHFNQLGLVMIDEQHRFGVGQRQALLDKGQAGAHLLQMTATPIPRSLALTVYGEMSVSTITELPAGRKPIATYFIQGDGLEEVYARIEEEVQQGHQIYYVLPLIDVSEAIQDVDSVMEVSETIRNQFGQVQVGVLHGSLTKEEQVEVMSAFKENKLQILVATTMVEVGVDVPNATVIVIQSAERFGLAQLHQLRGRVGRSHLPSYCYLVGNPTTDQGQRRLEIMTESQDGFYLSQEDLKIRGAGDLMGRHQSGIPQFYFANIIEDQHILTIARKDVGKLLNGQIEMSDQEANILKNWQIQKKIEL